MELLQAEYKALEKKRKNSYEKTQEALDTILCDLEASSQNGVQHPEEAMEVDTPSRTSEESERITRIEASLKKSRSDLTDAQKDVHSAFKSFGKAVDRVTSGKELETAVVPTLKLDEGLVKKVIAVDLYREGLAELGDTFERETEMNLDSGDIEPFEELDHVLRKYRAGDLELAIAWARKRREELKDAGSSLEFRLHTLEYIKRLKAGDYIKALKYARSHFGDFPEQLTWIKVLMGCLLYPNRLDESPYKDIMSPNLSMDVEMSFAREFRRLLGLPAESPLYTVVRCGTKALPTLIKAARVAPKQVDLVDVKRTLPVEIELDRDCRFHSIFACPVSREEVIEESNPPKLLPCGHVLSNSTVQRLPKGQQRFKCPYCPMEQHDSQCKRIYF